MFKSGFIGIIGKPNAGKSTLMNEVIGEKVAITTHKPQTTRNRIMGIKNTEEAQFIFIDTPGIHRARTPLNRYMVSTAMAALSEADVLLFLVEANKELNKDDHFILKSLEKITVPVILVINKIDLIEKNILLVLIDKLKDLYPFADIVPLSALKNFNVDVLLKVILKALPESPKLFPDDMLTDKSERFLASEMIREKITLMTHQEIPYSTAIVIDTFSEDKKKNLIRLQATINVEKESQKSIIIGKHGSMLKKIGTQARLDMEKFFGTKIYLDLFVRVQKDWTAHSRTLEDFGYKDR